MASDILSSFISAAAADTDGVSAVAAVANNANLVLGGALASGGAVTFDEPRNITILSSADDSGISFNVTGTDETGAAVVVNVAGADTGTTTGSTFFSTITQIAAVGDPAGNVSVGSGTSIAARISAGRLRLRGLYAVNTATAGTVSFRQESGTGTARMQFNTVASANTTQYPDIPDDGILFPGGGYVTYTQTTLSSMTVFYEG